MYVSRYVPLVHTMVDKLFSLVNNSYMNQTNSLVDQSKGHQRLIPTMEIITVVYSTLHVNEAVEEAWCYNFYLLLPFHCSVKDFLQNTKSPQNLKKAIKEYKHNFLCISWSLFLCKVLVLVHICNHRSILLLPEIYSKAWSSSFAP
jgi:hypothetical protein